MSSLPARLVARAAGRPWLMLRAGLALALAALWIIAARMAMTTDTSELISPNVPWRIEERRFEAAFPQLRDAMLVVVDGNTPERAEAAAAALADRLGTDTARFRRVTRPDGGEFFAREGLLYGTLDEVRGATKAMIEAQPLLGPLAADPSLRGIAGAVGTMLDGVDAGETSLARIDKPMAAMAGAIDAKLARKDPAFSWQRLFASEGAPPPPTRRLVLLQPVLDHSALEAGAPAAEAIATAAKALALDPAHGVTVRLTGEVPLADEEFATLQDNIGLVAMVMFGAMLVTLWLATRSVKLVIAILGTIVAGLVVTTALGLLAIGRLNLISIAFIPLFVGLGVDFGIQLAVRFNHERLEGAETAAALTQAARALGAPLTLAAGAVVLGFLAFLPTAYVGIAELGVIAGMGMIVALAFSLTLLPAAIVLLEPAKPHREVGIAAFAPADRWLAAHRGGVLWAFGIALVASIAALPLVGFDFNPLHLRDPEAPAMRTLADLTRDPDRSPATIDVLAKSPAEAKALSDRLAKLPEVRQVVTLDSFVPADQAPKLALIQDASLLLDLTLNPFDLPSAPSDTDKVEALRSTAARLNQRAGPDGSAARSLGAAFEKLAAASPAQRSAVEAMLTQPLGVMLDEMRRSLGAQGVTRETLPADLVRDWQAPGGLMRLQVFPRGDTTDNAALVRFRKAVIDVAPSASGLPVATQAAAGTVAGAFVQAGVIAFVLVSVLLLAVLRSVREVLFTLAPVVLSIFLTLGTCVVIGQPVNFANIIAFPLLFGVGVAFHIYFVMAWRAGARDLLQSSLARAVMFSAFATGTAFGSLWLSHHPGTASMGKILMISLIWTLICALVFEPALLGPPREDGAKA